MSLTTFVQEPAIRDFLKEHFQQPKFEVSFPAAVPAPPNSRGYSIVGTAFDYLLRFHIHQINPSMTISRKWVAEAAYEMMQKVPDFAEEVLLAKNLVQNAGKHYAEFQKSGAISDSLLQSCLHLAQMDIMYRTGTVARSLGFSYSRDMKDLRALIELARRQSIFRAKNLCILNPTFGMASHLVDGADGDLIIDDSLIDIKTTRDMKFGVNHFRQLMGYYLLSRIGGIDDTPGIEIKRLGIYYSRHGQLLSFEVEETLKETPMPRIIEKFAHMALDSRLALLSPLPSLVKPERRQFASSSASAMMR